MFVNVFTYQLGARDRKRKLKKSLCGHIEIIFLYTKCLIFIMTTFLHLNYKNLTKNTEYMATCVGCFMAFIYNVLDYWQL